MHHVREGKHGAASPQPAIAIGLSKARRAGVKLQARRIDTTSRSTRKKAPQELKRAQGIPGGTSENSLKSNFEHAEEEGVTQRHLPVPSPDKRGRQRDGAVPRRATTRRSGPAAREAAQNVEAGFSKGVQDDPKIEERPISALLAQKERQDGEEKKSGNIRYKAGGPCARAGGSIF